MRRTFYYALCAALLPAAPAWAQGSDTSQAPAAPAAEPPAAASEQSIYINGTIVLASEYRYRGVSYTNNDPTAQAYLTISHASGFYIGTFASNLSGYGSFGGDNLEADVYGGYTKTVGKLTLDGGAWFYNFPGTDNTDFFEIYASVAAPIGPGKLKVGAYYAPDQKNIGGNDDISAFADSSLPIKGTPFTLKAHVGYTNGKGSTLSGPEGHYWDFLIGGEVAYRNLSLNISYVDTTIDRELADSYYYIGGRRVIDGAALITLTATF
jgi:uncharacterized protein (TIGR02001 family)